MIKKVALFYLALVSSCLGYAQKEVNKKEANIWYLQRTGLNFNKVPTGILSDSKISGWWSYASTVSIADTTGKLLFYSDGDTVWNKEHRIMQNGTGIGGTDAHGNWCNIGVKLPGSDRYYYIFTSDIWLDYSQPPYKNDGVCFSIIDMKQDQGKGRVISKKNLLIKNGTGKIAAVLHANKRDVWIAVRQYRSDTLFLFLLTPSGLSPKVIKHNTYRDSAFAGQMKFSPDGKNLVMANIRTTYLNVSNNAMNVLYSFDNRTGDITNKRTINASAFWGIEFSPNSKYLYFYYRDSINKTNWFTQCPLKKITTNFIPDSTCFRIKDKYFGFGFQLAPNGKLYISKQDSFLTVVHHPDRFGVDCQYDIIGQNTIYANYNYGYGYGQEGFPGYMASYFRSPAFEITKSCIQTPVVFNLYDSTDADSLHWDFGDTASHVSNFSNKKPVVSHKYFNYGTYTVRLVTFLSSNMDTFNSILTFINPKPDFEALDVCENDSVRFNNKSSTAVGLLNYKWKFGDGEISVLESPKHIYTIGGISKTYNATLLATMADGCSDSITKPVTVNANPKSDFSYTSNQNKVDFKAVQIGNTSYIWYFGNGDSSNIQDVIYTYSKSGKYTACLKVINAAGCFTKTCEEVLITVGIPKSIKTSSFKIYPTPNSGNFTVEIDKLAKDVSIEVFDLMGKRVEKVERVEKVNLIDLDVEAGVYLLRLKNGTEVFNQKVVVSFGGETCQ